jgi:hypothetical protein
LKHHQPVAAGKISCPKFWARFLQEFLGAEKHLSIALWQQLYPSESQPLMYQLSRIHDLGSRPDAILRFGQLATPTLILMLCARLAPEDGRPRCGDIVQLEAAVLAMCDSQGKWF